MGNSIEIRKSQSVWKEIEKMQDRILKRAYEIFNGNGGIFGKDLDNWLAAERELVWKPAIELREKDKEFDLQIALPGIDAKDLDIEVTPDTLLVKAETRHEQEEKKGNLYTCEFQTGNVFRSVHFPKKVNPEKVKAEFKNGMLTITAEIAEASQAARKVAIEAA